MDYIRRDRAINKKRSILNGASTKSSIKLPYFITRFDVARNRSTGGQNTSHFYPL